MKVTLLAASTRINSNSLIASKAIGKILTGLDCEVEIIDFSNRPQTELLDIVQKDAEQESEFIKTALAKISTAQLVYIVTPEYNWMPSTTIQNFLHRFFNKNFSNVWSKKVFALVGVSSGRGGRLPQLEISKMLNKLISVDGYDSIVSPFFWESQFTQDNNLDDGSFKNGEYAEIVKAIVKSNIHLAEIWHKGLA